MICDGKERFTTFSLADMVARKRRRQGTKRQPYKCGECGAFHIGSHLGDRQRPRRDGYFAVLEPELA